MNTNLVDNRLEKARSFVPTVSASRLAELHAMHQDLRSQRRHLISQIQEQLDALSSWRRGIQRVWEHETPGRQDETPALRLQDEYGLTRREAEVARLLAEGLSNSALARSLGISPHTARHHTQRVLGKLGVHSRAEAGACLRRW